MKRLIFLIIIFSLLFGAVVFAQETELPSPGLTPDSPFYFLDTLGEKIGMFFTFGAEKKAEKALDIAEEKLAEAKKMAEENKLEDVEKANKKYQEFLDLANKKTKEAKEKGKDVGKLVTLISEKTLKHQEVLSQVYEKVSKKAKRAIEKAIEVSQKGFEEAIKAVSGAKRQELEQKFEKSKEKVQEKVEGIKKELPQKTIKPSVTEEEKVEKEEAKETVQAKKVEEEAEKTVPTKEVEAKEEPPIYKGAAKFELPSEMEENIRKGGEFPESTRIVAYATEDAPNQIYQWYQQELERQGWKVIDIGEEEDILWRKDNKILMIGVTPAETAKEMGIEKNLIFHMTNEYSNWEDYLLKEWDVIPDKISAMFEKWIDSIFKGDWDTFFAYTVDIDGKPYSPECRERAKKSFSSYKGQEYSLQIKPRVETMCIDSDLSTELRPKTTCINYTIAAFGSSLAECKQIIRIEKKWKVLLPCKDYQPL